MRAVTPSGWRGIWARITRRRSSGEPTCGTTSRRLLARSISRVSMGSTATSCRWPHGETSPWPCRALAAMSCSPGTRGSSRWHATRSVGPGSHGVRSHVRCWRRPHDIARSTPCCETYQIFGPVGAARLLEPGVAVEGGAGASPHRDLAGLDELATGSPVERVTALATRGYLTNQLLRDIDAVSMAHSLEVRVPYLDTVVDDTALSLPDVAKLGDVHDADEYRQTYRQTETKRVLIDVGRRWLPHDYDVQ